MNSLQSGGRVSVGTDRGAPEELDGRDALFDRDGAPVPTLVARGFRVRRPLVDLFHVTDASIRALAYHGRVKGAPVRAAVGLLLLLAAATTAVAQPYPPVTDRDFALDLYQGAVLGSVRIVGMGGAHIAASEGVAGIAGNPASAGVRATTSTGNWDWDWNIDGFKPVLGDDYDNNGMPTTGIEGTEVGVFGLGVYYRQFALALSAGAQEVAIEQSGGAVFFETALVLHLVAAATVLDDQLTIGAGARIGGFGLSRGSGADATDLISLIGAGPEAGVTWRPRDGNLRLGASGAVAITSESVSSGRCTDPLDCDGFIIPGRAVTPWQIGLGAAWRRAPTTWNRRVPARWRDERSLLVAADVLVTGGVEDGHGIEAYSQKQLQPSGRSTAVSVRGGVEYEWIPGWLRVRGGSYWEPERFPGVGGRIHVTTGLEVRVWSFCFWNERYRLRLAVTSDGARDYANGGLSIGFWH
jgi:hypothetical protein